LGSPSLQHCAAGATQAIATALGAAPVFLRTPGVARTPELRDAALTDSHVRSALALLDDLDIAFVGVGPADVHSRLEPGDAYFTTRQLAQARALGAVGQLNQRFLAADGSFVSTPLDALVVGSTLEQIGRARRRVIVAGGSDKVVPICAALRGRWVDTLITDTETASALLAAG
ncbi:MAG: sugar-binding domain-containing protein, partial [Marmoricola sp.]